MGKVETTPRERLIAEVALIRALAVIREVPLPEVAWDAERKAAEGFVEALEAEPDSRVKCPCCEKLVQLCVKHYQLHEPGKPCVICRREGE